MGFFSLYVTPYRALFWLKYKYHQIIIYIKHKYTSSPFVIERNWNCSLIHIELICEISHIIITCFWFSCDKRCNNTQSIQIFLFLMHLCTCVLFIMLKPMNVCISSLRLSFYLFLSDMVSHIVIYLCIGKLLGDILKDLTHFAGTFRIFLPL